MSDIKEFTEDMKKDSYDLKDLYARMKTIMDQLSKDYNYESTIVNTEKAKFLLDNDLRTLSAFTIKWVNEHDKFLGSLKESTNKVVEFMKQERGVKINRFGECINITLNEEEFIYNINTNLEHEGERLWLSNEQKSKIAKQEYIVVKEIADVLCLDIYLELCLEKIKKIGDELKIIEVCNKLSVGWNKDQIENIEAIHNYWEEIKKIFQKMKGVAITAIEVDKEAIKEATKLIDMEKSGGAKSTKTKWAVDLAILAGKTMINLIGVGTAIQVVADVAEFIHKNHSKDVMKIRKMLENDIIKLDL